MREDTPQELYRVALEERKSKDHIKRIDGCEKGYLASVRAIDEFLGEKGLAQVPEGTANASKERWKGLDRLVAIDPILGDDLEQSFAYVEDKLHGACFYQGSDTPHNDNILRKHVHNILEKTEHPLDFED